MAFQSLPQKDRENGEEGLPRLQRQTRPLIYRFEREQTFLQMKISALLMF